MSPKMDEEINVLTPAAKEPISNYEMVMSKIEHDSHKKYNGIENIALEKDKVES